MKNIILLSCDGLNVDVEKVIKVENDKVEEGVISLFEKVFKNDYNGVGFINSIYDIIDYEVDSMEKCVEREFDCCNENNSIIVVDESVDIEKKFGKYNYNVVVE